jgi:hypothetical protein
MFQCAMHLTTHGKVNSRHHQGGFQGMPFQCMPFQGMLRMPPMLWQGARQWPAGSCHLLPCSYSVGEDADAGRCITTRTLTACRLLLHAGSEHAGSVSARHVVPAGTWHGQKNAAAAQVLLVFRKFVVLPVLGAVVGCSSLLAPQPSLPVWAAPAGPAQCLALPGGAHACVPDHSYSRWLLTWPAGRAGVPPAGGPWACLHACRELGAACGSMPFGGSTGSVM